MSPKPPDPTTESFPPEPGIFPVPPDAPWRDVAVVIAATAACTVLADRYQLSERLYALTRTFEYVQLDELPFSLLALTLGLMWLAWRRFRHAGRALAAHRHAEARLAGVLAENRRLAQEHLRIQENERKHLARELHDELGQYLNAIKLDALALRGPPGADTGAEVGAAAIVRSVDHLHEVVSAMIARLRPVGLDELGLIAAIEHCVDQWQQRQGGTRFSLAVEGDFDELDENLAVTVYRIVQEALTNVSKHAHATQVEVELQLERGPAAAGAGDRLRLRIEDDGVGMTEAVPAQRFGLRGMRERVELAGGLLTLRSAPGQGLCLEARLPLGADR